MADHIFARNPRLVAAALEVFQQKTEEGFTPEAAMGAVIDRVLPLHAHELAEKQRSQRAEWEGSVFDGGLTALGAVDALIDLIAPAGRTRAPRAQGSR